MLSLTFSINSIQKKLGDTCFTGSGEGTLFTWSGSSGSEVKGAKHDKKV